jgi:hypothetical protein
MCGIAGVMYRGSDKEFSTGEALIRMLDGIGVLIQRDLHCMRLKRRVG